MCRDCDRSEDDDSTGRAGGATGPPHTLTDSYPEVVSVKLDGKLELPQTDECGGSTRDVRDAAHDAGDLPTEQLLLVQQRLWKEGTPDTRLKFYKSWIALKLKPAGQTQLATCYVAHEPESVFVFFKGYKNKKKTAEPLGGISGHISGQALTKCAGVTDLLGSAVNTEEVSAYTRIEGARQGSCTRVSVQPKPCGGGPNCPRPVSSREQQTASPDNLSLTEPLGQPHV
jgi:hypothetical protein